MAVAVLVLLLVRRRSSLDRRNLRGLPLTLALGVLGGAVALAGRGGYSLVERLSSLTQIGGGTIATRAEIYSAGWQAAWSRPVLGWGLDSFAFVFPRYASPEYLRVVGLDVVTDHPHSLALQLAVGMGLPGALLGLGLVVAGLYLSIRRLVPQPPSRAVIMLAGVWAACLGFFAQTLLT